MPAPLRKIFLYRRLGLPISAWHGPAYGCRNIGRPGWAAWSAACGVRRRRCFRLCRYFICPDPRIPLACLWSPCPAGPVGGGSGADPARAAAGRSITHPTALAAQIRTFHLGEIPRAV